METTVHSVDIFDKDGNLLRIEFLNEKDQFEFQSIWDSNDEQTHENREKFRKWSSLMAKRMGFKVSI
jgi:hypothetical protein